MRAVHRVLEDLNLLFYKELLEEYDLHNVEYAAELGQEEYSKKLLEIGVDVDHVSRISAEVFYTSYLHTTKVSNSNQEQRVSAAEKDDESADNLENWSEAQVRQWIQKLAKEGDEVFDKCERKLASASSETSLDGETLHLVVQSSREMREVLGLETIQERVHFEKKMISVSSLATKGSEASASNAILRGTYGSIYNERFVLAISDLYNFHMGCENMGPMLYNIVRFTKSARLLEIGAGYTSAFLLQALKDNAEEIQMCSTMESNGFTVDGQTPFYRKGLQNDPNTELVSNGVLHCVDNMLHEHTTAHILKGVAKRLGLSKYLKLHVADGFEFYKDLEASNTVIDLMWVDFGAGNKLDSFFEHYWPLLNPKGGLILVHSTLTNRFTRRWLEQMRSRATPSTEGGLAEWDSQLGEFVTLSFFEPHKMFQNSFSIFQRRTNDYSEPLYTTYP